jgi:adenine-specific DNA-methyltransferase
MAKNTTGKTVETLTHDEASRKNIPTAEYQSVMRQEEQSLIRAAYERRNRDLDPQLVWRGKDEQDWSDLVVQAPPLYIQEKIHPKVLIDDLIRRTKADERAKDQQLNLFADFNGLPNESAKTEFYQHDANWSNRMILGDSLQVMASLAEREGLRGKVQCIYIDPPYGIKFNSNFQWSTTSRDVKDGNLDHITREPEQVKAYRDTWRDGIHSYLTYLRDRLTVARDLLCDSGSVFVQIGDQNVHRVRALMDEVFGDENAVALIAFKKTSGAGSISGRTMVVPQIFDYIIWYAKSIEAVKYRQLFLDKIFGEEGASQYQWIELDGFIRRRMRKDEREGMIPEGARIFGSDNLTSSSGVDKTRYPVSFEGQTHRPHPYVWKTHEVGMSRLIKSRRVIRPASNLSYVRYIDDFPARPITNLWVDTASSFMADKVYVVQTNIKIVERCILMATDPGDLVLDPTCGSGTTAYVAEQWGRRWITIDTSRVALALARARIMGARYPYYILADSRDGQFKEAEVTRTAPSEAPTRGDIRQGFVYERVPHITLKSIANNAEIDVIWERYEQTLAPLRDQLSVACGQKRTLEEWEIPREWPSNWPQATESLITAFWSARIARQKEIDASIAAKAEFEYLYDKPYEDKRKVRVAGPFTVESLSPHRVLAVDENDELIDGVAESGAGYGEERDFVRMILENLKNAGVQQAHKEDKINFSSITPWPGEMICAEGRFTASDQWLVTSGQRREPQATDHRPLTTEQRAAIFIGPEFGTVSRPDLVAAAREAGDAGFDVLIACAFNYDAHSSEFNKLGRIPVLKARMNADLHMAGDLKNTGKGNLFVIFGEPDIDILDAEDGRIQVKINGVDVFHPQTGEVRSDGAEGIACWFIDTDYNEESFFVRHAYFLGANDPYKALKTTLKAEINEEAWETLHSDTSRPFDKPKSGRIAVKVINHLGDEVMKVFRVKGAAHPG